MKRSELEELFNLYLNRQPSAAEYEVHGDKKPDEFKVELLNSNEYKKQGREVKRSEIQELFNAYLNRNPTETEYRVHGNKKYEDFRNELLNCNEYRALNRNTQKRSDKKIAILLSGHIRNNTIMNTLNNMTRDYHCDVFIHTWDTIGKKGKETDLKDLIEKNKVIDNINKIKNVQSFLIENNREYIESIKTDTETQIYFNFSSPEIFIKSQLYSINRCYKLMEDYSKKNKITYSAVFRVRFDCEFTSFNLTESILHDINNNKIIFVSNKDCGHNHIDSDSTSCWACDRMYYTYGLKSVHIFEHTNVICDIFAFGSQRSMKDYCSLYNEYDKFNKSVVKENLKILENNNIPHTKNDNVYKLRWNKQGHLDSLYYLNCSYPERLIQKKLSGYMLLDSRSVKVKFKR